MRKLITGFVAGTLVTIMVMLAVLGERNDETAPSGNDDEGLVAVDSPVADPQDVERRRQAALSVSSPNATDSRRVVQREGGAPRSDESDSPDCCTLGVVPDSGDSTDIDELAAVPLLAHSAPELGPSRPYLTGKWEGVMTRAGAEPDGSPSVVPPFDPTRDQYGFRLDIRESHLVMYFQSGDQWISLGDGQDLRTNEQGRSAIVTTVLGNSNGGIEAMMLNIVRWNEGTIAVHVSRVAGAGSNGGPVPPPVNSMGILSRAQF